MFLKSYLQRLQKQQCHINYMAELGVISEERAIVMYRERVTHNSCLQRLSAADVDTRVTLKSLGRLDREDRRGVISSKFLCTDKVPQIVEQQ